MSPRAPYATVEVGPDRLSLLKDGGQTFDAMLEAIAAAKVSVALETYILKEDVTGRRFAQALVERARAGVAVYVLYDAWGSEVSPGFVEGLRADGVRVLAFGPVRSWRGLERFWAEVMRRNHRKCLVVDGKVGFTGGLNIADDYAASEDGGGGWRDTHVRLEGPAAGRLLSLFVTTWNRVSKRPDIRFEALAPGVARGASGRVDIADNSFQKDRKAIRAAYMRAIDGARGSILLTQAYFMPPARVVRRLKRAARRGVRVAVIVAGETDVWLVKLATRGLYASLLRGGLEVYEWHGRVLHAKTAVVDGRWATVGSANLDALSLRQNLEVNAVVEDEAFAQAVERMFHEDLADCRPVTWDFVRRFSLPERALWWLALRLRRWL